jgi:hypothetical protein
MDEGRVKSPYPLIEHLKWYFYGEDLEEGEPRFGFGDFW